MRNSFSGRMRHGIRKVRPPSFGIKDSNKLSQADLATRYSDFAIWGDRLAGTALPALEERTLPNGVKNDPYLQRVSWDYRLINVESVIDIMTNLTWAIITLPSDCLNVSLGADGGKVHIDGISPGLYFDNASSIMKWAGYDSPNRKIVIGLPKGTTLEQAKLLLGNTNARYQLATPIDRLNTPLLSNPRPARTLPNGVQNDPATIKVSEDYVLQASDIAVMDTTQVGHDLLNLNPLSNLLQNTAGSGIPGFVTIDGDDRFSVLAAYSNSVQFGHYSSTNLRLVVPKGFFQTLTDAKNFFAGKIIRYQLATPITQPAVNPVVDMANRPGKNLLDLPKALTTAVSASVSYNQNGFTVFATDATSATKRVVFTFKLKPNTQYTLQYVSTKTGVGGGGVVVWGDSDGAILLRDNEALSGTRSFTFTTTPTGITVIRFYCQAVADGATSQSATFTNIQLEEGAVATAYEPYTRANVLLQGMGNTLTSGLCREVVKGVGDKIAYANLVTNGDFSQGMTGWYGYQTTVAASSNTLTGTATGAGSSAWLIQASRFTPGKRYYTRARVMVDNAVCSAINIRGNTGELFGTLATPAQGQWYNLSGIKTMVTDVNLEIQSVYPDAATATGKVLSAKEVEIVCLSDNPAVLALERELGRQLTKEECDYLFSFVPSTGEVKARAVTGIKPDGVNDVGILGGQAPNPVGTQDFGFAFVFKTPATLKATNFWIAQRNYESSTDSQWGFLYDSTAKNVLFYLNAGSPIQTLSQSIAPSTLYLLRCVRKNGVIRLTLNDITRFANDVTSIIGKPFARLFARSNNTTGTDHVLHADISLLFMAYNNGHDLVDWEWDMNRFVAETYGIGTFERGRAREVLKTKADWMLDFENPGQAGFVTLEPRTLPNGVKNDPYLQRVSWDISLLGFTWSAEIVDPVSNYIVASKPADSYMNNKSGVSAQGTVMVIGIPETTTGASTVRTGPEISYSINATQLVCYYPKTMSRADVLAILAEKSLRYQLATPIDRLNAPLLRAPKPPRTLPNRVQNDPATIRVSEDYLLKASDVGSVVDRANFTQAFVTTTIFNPPTITFVDAAQGTIKVNGWTEKANSINGSYVPNLFATRSDDVFIFDVPLGTTLEKAREILAGTVIRYQLATPITEPATNLVVDAAGTVGKNLFDPALKVDVAAAERLIIPDGQKLRSTSVGPYRRVIYRFDVKKNTDYSLSYIASQISGVDLFWGVVTKGSEGLPIGALGVRLFDRNGNGAKSGNFNTGSETVIYVVFFITQTTTTSGGEFDVTNIQLEEGGVATAYEPYGKANALPQGFGNTASSGLVREVVKGAGSRIKYQNLITNGDFSQGTTGWSGIDSVVGGIAEKTPTVQYGGISQERLVFYQPNKRYYASGLVKADSTSVNFTLQTNLYHSPAAHSGSGLFERLSVIYPATPGTPSFANVRVRDERVSGWTKLYLDEVQLICLDDNPQVLALEAELGRQLTVKECDYLFAFTASSAEVKARAATGMKGDGVNDVLILGGQAPNPVGTQDFAFGFVLNYVKNVSVKTIASRRGSNVQYRIYLYDGMIYVNLGGTLIDTPNDTITSGLNKILIKKMNNVLSITLNGVQVVISAFATSLVSELYSLLMGTTTDGITNSSFSNDTLLLACYEDDDIPAFETWFNRTCYEDFGFDY